MDKLWIIMSSKLFPILFMIILSIPISGIAHAEVNSDISVNGAIIQSYVVDPIREGDTSIHVTVTLNPSAVDDTVDKRTGAIVSINVIDNDTLISKGIVSDTLTIEDNLLDGTTNVLTSEIDLNGIMLKQLDLVHVTVKGQSELDNGTFGHDVKFAQATDTATVQEPALCGYQTIPVLDYGTMNAGDAKTMPFTPTITDTDAYTHPTMLAFNVNDWTYNGDIVVEKSKTSIDGTSGDNNIVISDVTQNQQFDFTTTLEFTSAEAHNKSLGKIITQNISLTPQCNIITESLLIPLELTIKLDGGGIDIPLITITEFLGPIVDGKHTVHIFGSITTLSDIGTFNTIETFGGSSTKDLIITSNVASYNANYALEAGNYQVQLTVYYDDNGSKSTTSTLDFTVPAE